MQQRLVLSGSQCVRAVGSDHLVTTPMGIDALADELLQEDGHGSARALERRLQP
jgi:hypothetical protein